MSVLITDQSKLPAALSSAHEVHVWSTRFFGVLEMVVDAAVQLGPTCSPKAQTFRRLHFARFDLECYADMLHTWKNCGQHESVTRTLLYSWSFM